MRAYRAIDCAGMARVDFLLEKGAGGRAQIPALYLNEVNTIPGFTNISMYPSLLRHAGVEYTALITRLIQLALERNQSNHRITTNYDSEL